MLSTWTLSPSQRQVPLGMMQSVPFPEVLPKDTAMYVLKFLKGFNPPDTKFKQLHSANTRCSAQV